MKEADKNSVLVAGVPPERGTPTHYEHDDDTAVTVFHDDQVVEIHTPKEIFPRVHELMHSRHSNETEMRKQYRDVNWLVAQVIEDCKIHLTAWPWDRYSTPDIIREATLGFLKKEQRAATATMKKDPKFVGSFADFGTRLRRAAIIEGMDGPWKRKKERWATSRQKRFADDILGEIAFGNVEKAAKLLHSAFFDPLPKPPEAKSLPRFKIEDGEFVEDSNDNPELEDGLAEDYVMEVIELPHTEKIPSATVGYRKATTGSRLHRPSLRKPVLPQRLFVRRAPVEPGGTILIDASGSMGGWNVVKKWAENAPFSTVAYYAGDDGGEKGWLYVYARRGLRATKIVEPPERGNLVDGKAIDWLLSERAPRIMVTDRGFCGASDSAAQVVRLDRLEREGTIKVERYK